MKPKKYKCDDCKGKGWIKYEKTDGFSFGFGNKPKQYGITTCPICNGLKYFWSEK